MEFMIIQITIVAKHTIKDLNMKFAQKQNKNRASYDCLEYDTKIENKTGERFSDHQKKSKKTLLRCFSHIYHI